MSHHTDVRSPDLRRSAGEIVADYRRRRAGYTPDWSAGERDPGFAVVRAEAAMLASLWERLDRVPDKHKLAFLDELGVDSLPPAAARAPVMFTPMPLAGSSIVPEGSLVGAEGEGGNQITYRTEHGIGVTSSRLAEVHTVVPGRDTTGDHSIDAIGLRPVELFADQRPTERYLYVGHERLLAIRGNATISVEFELARDAQIPLTAAWSIWDGAVWRDYQEGFGSQSGIADQTDTGSDDEPRAFGQSGVVSLFSSCIESAPTTVDGIEAYWIRVRLETPLSLVEPLKLPEIDQIRLAVELGTPHAPVQFPVETALALGQPVDVTSPFYPLGRTPDRTNAWYVDAAAAVAAKTERIRLSGIPEGGRSTEDPTIEAEYWDGAAWRWRWSGRLGTGDPVPATDEQPPRFAIEFEVPPNWAAREVDGETGTWLRLRLAPGEDYVGVEQIDVPIDETNTAAIDVPTHFPVRVSDLRFEVHGRSLASAADHVVAFDGALHTDHSVPARWRGQPFAPFRPRGDRSPTLYLGFDGPLPAANLGLYFDVAVDPDAEGGRPEHEFRWERYDGTRWVSLPVEDETEHLTSTGIVRLLWPGNRNLRSVHPVVASELRATTQSTAAARRFEPGELVHLREGEQAELATIAAIDGSSITLAKPLEGTYQNATIAEPEPALFGMPRTWIRARLSEGSPQPSITLQRILPNVAWASEHRRIRNQIIGSGNGQPNQRMFSTHTPLLPGVAVEVRELSGARARTDLALVERELAGTAHEIAVDTDAAGDVAAVWVRWETRSSLASSGPLDRHCVVDLVRGIVRFGDDRAGRALPTGGDNVRLTADVGGGAHGNVGAGAIKNPLSGMVVAEVANTVAATGGADAESAARARRRAPEVVRHRYQAVTHEDFRSIALEASPEVFDASVVRQGDDLGGRLRLHVLPASSADDPTPSAQLLERVERHVRRRCPAGAADVVDVDAPTFVEIGVAVTLAAVPGQAEVVFDRVRAALRAFLHPVTGGPGARTATEPLLHGWAFGSTIHTARFAQLLESVEGVDYVESFSVTSDGAFAGDTIQLGGDAVPLPGPFDVRLVRSEADR